jgi:glycosyltransferase involved in cell wall biosynthesis
MAAVSRPFLDRALSGFRRTDFAICISEHVKWDACEYLKLLPDRVFVAPLAADRGKFYPCDDPARFDDVRTRYNIRGEAPYFLSLTAVEPRKNLPALIRAFAQLQAQESAAREILLVLVGSAATPEQEQSLAAAIAANNVSDNVIVTGFVADEDLAPLYSGALAFVFPSLAEGFGLPPLEAMQCGTAVVCSDRTSLPEVVGDAALLVNPEDVDAIAGAMLQLLGNEPLRARLSAASIARAERFSWSRCADDHVRAYETAIALAHSSA